MVMSPRFAEDLALIVQLSGEIFAQIAQSVLELFLEGVQDVVHILHGLHRLLLVFLDLTVVYRNRQIVKSRMFRLWYCCKLTYKCW